MTCAPHWALHLPLTQPAPAAASSSTGSPSTDPSTSRAAASTASYTPAQLPASLLAYKNFVLARAAVLSRVASHGQQTTTVEFERLWWDKRAKHPSLTKVSFWRPVAPPGYVALGDCMVTGMYAPPQGVLVLRDADPAENLEEGPPLLARPLSYVPVSGCSAKEVTLFAPVLSLKVKESLIRSLCHTVY